MNVPDLIAAFEDRVTLPIDVNDVLECLRAHGHTDDIDFIGVDLDPDILQGHFEIYHVRKTVYGDPERCANIYYHRGHPLHWQRMICCKELTHVLDPKTAYTAGAAAIRQLADRMGLPPELQNPMSDGFEVSTDRVAEVRALALLMPMAARNVLYDPYRNRDISLTDVARIADIPTRYASLAMHDIWPEIYDVIMRRKPPAIVPE